MNFKIYTNADKKFKINLCFDLFGNLYFDTNLIKDDKFFSNVLKHNLHQICVDGKNEPYVESGEYQIISNEKLNKSFDTMRKIKIKDKYENSKKTYYYENNKQNINEIMIDEKITKSFGQHNIPFVFSSLADEYNINIEDRMFGDIAALYDTYIYKNNLLCFNSNSFTNDSIYKFYIYEDGRFYIKIVGHKRIPYKVKITEIGDIVFIKQ